MPFSGSGNIRELAAQLGIGKSTVARALNGDRQVAADTRAKVMAAAKAAGYRSLPSVRQAMHELRADSNRARHSHLAWLDTHLYSDHLQETVFRAAEKVANRYGYDLLKLDDKLSPSRMTRLLRSWNARAIVGIRAEILMGKSEWRLLKEPIPMVIVSLAARMGMPVPTISIRLTDVAKIAVSEAFTCGYRRLGVIINPTLSDPENEFAGAWAASLRQLGMSETIPYYQVRQKDRDRGGFIAWIEEHRIDCVCSFDSQVALYLQWLGARVPEQVGFIMLARSILQGPDDVAMVDDRLPEMAAVATSRAINLAERSIGWELELEGRTMIEPCWRPGRTIRSNEAAEHIRSVAFPDLTGVTDLKFLPIDFSRYTNRPIMGPGGWFGGEGLGATLGAGAYEFAGVPFQIVEDASSRLGQFLLMRSGHGSFSRQALPTEITIPIDRPVRAIFILHAAAYVGDAEPLAHYLMEYCKGNPVRVAVVAGQTLQLDSFQDSETAHELNIHDWWKGASTIETEWTKPVWLSHSGNTFIETSHLYVHRWNNPFPKKRLKQIRIVSVPSARTTLGVLAMTSVTVKS